MLVGSSEGDQSGQLDGAREWEAVMTFTATDIQQGWTVWASDGKQIGTVVSVDPQVIVVKEDGLLGGRIEVPPTAVDEIETGRIDLSMTKQELKSGS
jgi:hypothetical protein